MKMKKSLLKVDRKISKNPENFQKFEKSKIFDFRFFLWFSFDFQKFENFRFFRFSEKFLDFFENFRSTFKSDFFIFTSSFHMEIIIRSFWKFHQNDRLEKVLHIRIVHLIRSRIWWWISTIRENVQGYSEILVFLVQSKAIVPFNRKCVR